MSYVAFLRAINVGGHVVKMDRLRQLFESLGFSNVTTVIASGNVLFRSAARNPRALESTIARRLQEALGYEVSTFIRSPKELTAIAAYTPFREADLRGPRTTLYVGFLADTPSAATCKTVLSLRTSVDEFHTHQRELYWLCRVGMGQSAVSGARLEKALGARVTFRNVATVTKLAARCTVAPPI